jgi:type II secretory pathway pseudopilin PulG
MRKPHPQQRDIRDQRGWTLIELLVAMTMTIAILMAALPIVDGATRTQGRVQKASEAIGDARNFSELVLNDLRGAYDWNPPTSPNTNANSISVDTYVHTTACGSRVLASDSADAQKCRVTYVCSGGACTRQERNEDGSGTGAPVTMITGLSSNNVFDPVIGGDDIVHYVTFTLVLPNQSNVGDDAITLTDGVALRNVE